MPCISTLYKEIKIHEESIERYKDMLKDPNIKEWKKEFFKKQILTWQRTNGELRELIRLLRRYGSKLSLTVTNNTRSAYANAEEEYKSYLSLTCENAGPGGASGSAD